MREYIPVHSYHSATTGGPCPRFEDLAKKIDVYFNTVSDEQLQKDLEEAGYRTYCQIPNFL